MSKAENRFEDEKRKKRTRKLLKNIWHDAELADDDRFVGIEAGVHSRRCSCDMCKRSRKNPWKKGNGKLTRQERRMDEAESEDW